MAASTADSLPGELQVCHVSEVQMIMTTRPSVTPILGHLASTNLRLKFTPLHVVKEKDAVKIAADQIQIYFGAIQSVSSVSGHKRRILDPKNTLPRNLEVIEVYCKDFRRVIFNFKNCRKNEANSMMNAILVYSQPQHRLIFAFDYAKELRKSELEHSIQSTSSDHCPVSFLNARDWEKELQRLGAASSWRVCEINHTFTFSDSLPPYFVVPDSMADPVLHHVARQHHGTRLPVWCWSHPIHGSSIARCSGTTSGELDRPSDVNYLSAMACGRSLNYFDVAARCCTVKDVATSFVKLKEICMPVTEHDIKNVEKRWMSLLQSSRWLEIVRLCLKGAVEVKQMVCEASSVLLFEPDGKDVSGVVSSLVQLMCDPHCRSIAGFETLIQKEWVALGHPFCTRNKLITCFKGDEESDNIQAPIFLVFLDCVWQLSQQFPSAFAFSGVYLKQLYSCTLSNLYGTFVFDNARDMYDIVNSVQIGGKKAVQKPLTFAECVSHMESAWNGWVEQLSLPDEKEDYFNPLYYLFSSQAIKEPSQNMSSPLPIDNGFVSVVVDDDAVDEFLGGLVGLYDTPGERSCKSNQNGSVELNPNTSATHIKFWSQLYFSGLSDINQPDRQRLYVQRQQSQLVCHIRKQRNKLHIAELANGSFAFDLISSQSLGSTFGGSSDMSSNLSLPTTAITASSNGDISESPLTQIMENGGLPNRRGTYHGEEDQHSPLARSASSTPHSPNIVKTKMTIRREKEGRRKQARNAFTAVDSPPIIMTKMTTKQTGYPRTANGQAHYNNT